jgi:hypothetical protein
MIEDHAFVRHAVQEFSVGIPRLAAAMLWRRHNRIIGNDRDDVRLPLLLLRLWEARRTDCNGGKGCPDESCFHLSPIEHTHALSEPETDPIRNRFHCNVARHEADEIEVQTSAAVGKLCSATIFYFVLGCVTVRLGSICSPALGCA